MAFPTKLLNDGEEVVLDLRPHWWFMFKATAALLGTVVLGAVVIFVLDNDDTLVNVARWLTIALVLAALAFFVVRYLKWRTTNFVVTSDRLIYRVGVLAKTGIEIPLERVNTVFFNQGIFERLLGAGDLAIESGGETGKQTFTDIRKPSEVQNVIYRQMEDNNARMYAGRTGTTPPPAAGTSITQQIEELDALRQRGVITDAEFAAKKADLLDRM